MKLLSWNVNGRVGDALSRQLDAIGQELPDLLALQEVTAVSGSAWTAELERLGHEVMTSVDRVGEERRYANLLASRWSVTAIDTSGLDLPEPEKLLSGLVATPAGEVEVHVVHAPPGVSRPAAKVESFERIAKFLAHDSAAPRILCGDFNTPREERPDGTVVTWAGNKRRDLRVRWDAAERGVLEGLAEFDLSDTYRALNGWDGSEGTWSPPGQPVVRRYDHLFASRSLLAEACRYRHDWREEGLSDHSALVGEFGFC